jgi:hypothetical protein
VRAGHTLSMLVLKKECLKKAMDWPFSRNTVEITACVTKHRTTNSHNTRAYANLRINPNDRVGLASANFAAKIQSEHFY